MERENLETKNPETVEGERIMRKDAEKQIELAVHLHARTYGMGDSIDSDFIEKALVCWTEKGEDGKSPSEKYREFIESEKFRNDKKWGGNLYFVGLDDFI